MVKQLDEDKGLHGQVQDSDAVLQNPKVVHYASDLMIHRQVTLDTER